MHSNFDESKLWHFWNHQIILLMTSFLPINGKFTNNNLDSCYTQSVWWHKDMKFCTYDPNVMVTFRHKFPWTHTTWKYLVVSEDWCEFRNPLPKDFKMCRFMSIYVSFLSTLKKMLTKMFLKYFFGFNFFFFILLFINHYFSVLTLITYFHISIFLTVSEDPPWKFPGTFGRAILRWNAWIFCANLASSSSSKKS